MTVNPTYEISVEDIEIFEKFMKWRAENHPIYIGHKRMEIEELNELIEDAFLKMDEINNYQGDYTSFMCGIGLGMKIIMGDD